MRPLLASSCALPRTFRRVLKRSRDNAWTRTAARSLSCAAPPTNPRLRLAPLKRTAPAKQTRNHVGPTPRSRFQRCAFRNGLQLSKDVRVVLVKVPDDSGVSE